MQVETTTTATLTVDGGYYVKLIKKGEDYTLSVGRPDTEQKVILDEDTLEQVRDMLNEILGLSA